MDKRYQVFVSSTFIDLEAERQEVMQALLELDCMPAGMELFPATNDDQWSLIKKVIDDSDYYIVILGGRYGSIGPDGFSYTEMEYRYAAEQGKPVIGFVHKNPGLLAANLCESSDEGKKKLESFRQLVQTRLCKHWESASELGSQVSRSLIKLVRTSPAVGWVRADLVPSEGAASEMLSLRRRIEELEKELESARIQEPPGAEKLADVDDGFKVEFSFDARAAQGFSAQTFSTSIDITWAKLFFDLSPVMMNEASEITIKNAFNECVQEAAMASFRKQNTYQGLYLSSFSASTNSYHTVIIQFRAKGWITQSRPGKSYWVLTPYGDQIMTQLRAVHKEQPEDPEAPEA